MCALLVLWPAARYLAPWWVLHLSPLPHGLGSQPPPCWPPTDPYRELGLPGPLKRHLPGVQSHSSIKLLTSAGGPWG